MDHTDQIREAFAKAPVQIQKMITGKEVDDATMSIGFVYKIPINLHTHLKDIIILILLGIILPGEVVDTLKKELHVDEATAYKMAVDLDKSILQTTRIKLVGEDFAKDGVKKIKVGDTTSKEELRSQILDQTKKESALNKSPTEGQLAPKKKPNNGSRNQLIEQLQVLQSITNSEEVEARLSHIREQIASIDKKEEIKKTLTKAVEENIAERGDQLVVPKERVATYSRAPTHYNVDPYREVFED